ncbi:amidohydrolase [Arcanobacterium hippocoleae]
MYFLARRSLYSLPSAPRTFNARGEYGSKITEILTAIGYTVQQIGGGVVGVLKNGTGPTVLFRADIDALAVKEDTGLPYASTAKTPNAAGELVPAMHACGHDMHIAAALGAARALAEHQDEWAGTYIALFQPGEETAQGAKSMVSDGLTERIPTPDYCFAQHVLTTPESGKIGTADGPFLSTAASLRVKVFGKGTHGSMPHLGVDAVVLAAAIITRIQTIVSREVSPFDFGVVSVGKVSAGSAANVIPGEAELLLNVRAYSDEIREQLISAIKRIVTAECAASHSPKAPEIEVYDEYPLTYNDPELNQQLTAHLRSVLGAENVVDLKAQTASEDFSTIPNAFGCPYIYWGFGGFKPDQEKFPNHNPGFGPALQPSLAAGTKAAAAAAMMILGK